MSASEKTTAAASISTLPFHLLPKDIIVDILSKLPAKSLVRFKCVSKFFCVLITADHGFSVLHRSVSLTLPSRAGILIVIIPRTPHYTRSLPVFYTINFSEENRRPGKQLQANRVGYLDGEPYAIDHLRSSSDGLVCLHRNNRHVVVCNVSTRQRISLPRIPSDSPSNITYAMLGFDSKSKRYKVLVSAPNRYKYKHWVLTVGVDKSWREINNDSCSHLFHITLDSLGYPNFSDTSVYIDGVIYSYNYNWRIKVHPARFGIVAFEVGSESFSVIPLPREISSGNYSRHNYSRHAFGLLQVDGGRLAIVRKIDECMNLWTWEKFKKCWERSITIIPLKESSTSNLQMRFTTNHVGEIVLLFINIKQLSILIYNLKSKVWRKFDVGGVEEFPTVFDVRMYRTMDNVFSLEEKDLIKCYV
ncbi:PREDICTED: putative F-box protein At3g52320 [Ipomoea nil]|uniref:putative F-box protein At3g52320 n=1 Tax=Ipomoea nil TaxID=35883 RepID=UPI000901A7BA|nr:PREDICTED: putative F-box protein At3g52320 [Ipomoea nil]